MCGLVGFADPDGVIQDPVATVEEMVATLAHRGPDGQGVWHGGAVHLGHRRLAIIDTSDAGAQPMLAPWGSAIVFNGEIYNHVELREELETAGFRFRTRSDTEVLLAAWERWGPDCLDRLIGMFAFALWDPRQGRLFLARDRLGKKPLYLCQDGRFLAFASEPKALLAVERIRRRAGLDGRALADFLTLGYVLSPKSIYSNIQRLPAGCWAEYGAHSGTLRIQEYWKLEEHVLAHRMPYDEDARHRFRELLEDAVRIRLRADVPVGCFLSGGIDSSTIAALVARVSKQPMRAFCVGFAESSFDERAHARRVADHLGIEFTVLESGGADLAAIVRHCDEPFADTSLLPTWQLNAAASRHVKVALSGDGADEILAGYPTYQADRLYRFYRRVPQPIQAALDGLARRALKPSYRKLSLDYRVRQFLASRGLSPERAHAWWRVVFSGREIRTLLADDVLATIGDYDPLCAFEAAFERVRGADFLNRSLYVDIKTWLADDILVKVDRMSMAHGLEVRSPLLDHRVVEFALRLEPAAKIRGTRQKVALRDVAAPLLPSATLKRGKQGFGAPTTGFGAVAPPALDSSGLFRQCFRLDGLAEDITYKSLALGVLIKWLDLRRESGAGPERALSWSSTG